MSIGKNIQTLRKQNKMSQDQLAQKCNVSRQTISRWECDEVLPDTNNLITLSKLFNKSLDEIVFGKKEIISNSSSKSKIISMIIHIITISSLLIMLFIHFYTPTQSIEGVYKSFDNTDSELIIKIEEIPKKDLYFVSVYVNDYNVLQRNVYESDLEIDNGKEVICYRSNNSDLQIEYDPKLDVLTVKSKLIDRDKTNFILSRT